MNDLLVSIIIPIYNSGRGLSKSIESILSQTYKNIEIVLVDDGSKDDSFEICKSYSLKDKRITVIHTENQGSGPARNTGIAHAHGEWAYFPDSDDFLEPNAIERMVGSVLKSECDLLVFGFDTYDTNGRLISRKSSPYTVLQGDHVRQNYEHHCMMKDPLCIQGAPWNKFFNISIIRENDVSYPALRRHQDECFICRYVEYVKKVCFIPDVLYRYYANDSKAIRRKYPIDYIDCVKAVYSIKKEHYQRWNPNNSVMKDVLSDEFLCNLIWSLELSFNPRFNFSHNERYEWMKEQLSDVHFDELSYSLVNKRPYQRLAVLLLRSNLRLAYCLLKISDLIKSR